MVAKSDSMMFGHEWRLRPSRKVRGAERAEEAAVDRVSTAAVRRVYYPDERRYPKRCTLRRHGISETAKLRK